jgi:hypothetical protein
VLGSAPPGVRISVASGLEPGGHAVTKIHGEPWRVDDHGEMLAAEGDPDGPERAKCLYLAVAAAVGMEPAKLLGAMKKRARAFLKHVPKPKPGVLVPEAILYAFELAHDLVHRDHPQMRASFLWFGDDVLAHSQICFIVAVGKGDFRVEFMTGHKYSDLSDRGRLGFVECAASHARHIAARGEAEPNCGPHRHAFDVHAFGNAHTFSHACAFDCSPNSTGLRSRLDRGQRRLLLYFSLRYGLEHVL